MAEKAAWEEEGTEEEESLLDEPLNKEVKDAEPTLDDDAEEVFKKKNTGEIEIE